MAMTQLCLKKAASCVTVWGESRKGEHYISPQSSVYFFLLFSSADEYTDRFVIKKSRDCERLSKSKFKKRCYILPLHLTSQVTLKEPQGDDMREGHQKEKK